ncbi:MAG: cation-transporting P-type ATPase [Planctomycetota bacterium]
MGQQAASSVAGPAPLPERPWAVEAGAVAAALGVDPGLGLSAAEVLARRRAHGPNLLRETRPQSAWWVLVEQLRSLVVALLGAAAVVSFAFDKGLEGLAILLVVALNTAIGFATELRAVRSMEALRRMGQALVRVRREGVVRELPAGELVPGDLVLVEAGDVVTADLRLLEASKLQADESALTGESVPVGKHVAPVAADATLDERRDMLFKGTALTRGSGEAVVVATGMATELGRIASLAQAAEKAATPLERRLAELGRRLIWLTLAIAAVTSATGILRGEDWLLMLETGIALAVAAVPEGLPIVATLALARGMVRMARRSALVNRLAAVETLGATDVIFSDKTGTLTENRMTVTDLALAGGDVGVSGLGLELAGGFTRARAPVAPGDDPCLRRALEVAVLCNNASLARDEDGAPAGTGDPMEVALLVAGAKAGLERGALLRARPELREEAFDPERRMMATVHRDDGGRRVAVKGAAEAVLACCTRLCTPEGERALDDATREAWLARDRALASRGLRVLALADRRDADDRGEPYADLCLLGLVGMLDPPRAEVAAALEAARRAGVRVVMVTGDQAATAAAIARQLGLPGAEDGTVVHGRDLGPLDELDDETRRRLVATPIFARVDPRQKLELIALHQRAGSVVAMTGDGVNDAPALEKADIGIAMGRRGTQVAREAADMVLRDDAFASIVDAIHQGRVIFANIRRFVVFLLSCNLSEILVVFTASAVGLPLPVLPLQILYLNLVTDVFPALALGFGEGSGDAMRRPPRPADEPIVTRAHWREVFVQGLLITVAVLAALLLGLHVLVLGEGEAVTVSFLTLALAQVWHVFDMREPGTHPWRNDVARSPWVLGATALCVSLLLAAVWLPGLRDVLATVAPSPAGWALALGASLVPMVIVQVRLQRGAVAVPPRAPDQG